MKKLILILTIVTVCLSISSQVLNEDFESTYVGGPWPNGWTVDGTSGWTINDPSTGTPDWGGAEDIVDADYGNCTDVYAVVDSDGLGSGNTQSSSLVSPSFNLSSFNEATLTFNHYHRIYQTSQAYVEASIDNGVSWQEIAFYNATDFGAKEYDISSFTGQSNVKIRFRYEGSWEYWWAVDDVVIIGINSACVKPSNLVVSNITTNSADINWTPSGDETTWNIEWYTIGFNIGTGNFQSTNNPNFSLSNLESNTFYDFYVQANCENETSDLFGPISFGTNCESITEFPYLQYFEEYLGCWRSINNG